MAPGRKRSHPEMCDRLQVREKHLCSSNIMSKVTLIISFVSLLGPVVNFCPPDPVASCINFLSSRLRSSQDNHNSS